MLACELYQIRAVAWWHTHSHQHQFLQLTTLVPAQWLTLALPVAYWALGAVLTGPALRPFYNAKVM